MALHPKRVDVLSVISAPDSVITPVSDVHRASSSSHLTSIFHFKLLSSPRSRRSTLGFFAEDSNALPKRKRWILLLSLSVRKWETKPGNPYARIYWEAVLGARGAILGARQSEVD